MTTQRLLKLANYFATKYADDVAVGMQPGDYGKVLMPYLGSTPAGGGNYNFDPNSPAADAIFKVLEKLDFQGVLNITLSLLPNKQPQLNFDFKKGDEKKSLAVIKQINSLVIPKLSKELIKLPAPPEEYKIGDVTYQTVA